MQTSNANANPAYLVYATPGAECRLLPRLHRRADTDRKRHPWTRRTRSPPAGSGGPRHCSGKGGRGGRCHVRPGPACAAAVALQRRALRSGLGPAADVSAGRPRHLRLPPAARHSGGTGRTAPAADPGSRPRRPAGRDGCARTGEHAKPATLSTGERCGPAQRNRRTCHRTAAHSSCTFLEPRLLTLLIIALYLEDSCIARGWGEASFLGILFTLF